MNALLAALIFFTPSNWFLKFFENAALLHGLRVDYLLTKFSIFDGILLIIVTTLIFGKKKHEVQNSFIIKIAIITTLLVLLQLFASSNPLNSILQLLRLSLIVFIPLYVSGLELRTKLIQLAVISTTLLQSIVIWYQFLWQKSVFGYLFLGESNLSSYAGIAKTTVRGSELILPYGTTAHPNIIAGVLAFFIVLLYKQHLHKKSLVVACVGVFAFTALLLTHSASAMLSLAFGLTALFAQKKQCIRAFSLQQALIIVLVSQIFVAIATPIFAQIRPGDNSIDRRLYLQQSSIAMTMDHWTTGVGLTEFVRQVEKYSPKKEVVRFVQPVHSGILLIIAEVGLIASACLVWFALHTARKNKLQTVIKPEFLFLLIPIITWDHYILTSHTGLSLLLLLGIWNFGKE